MPVKVMLESGLRTLLAKSNVRRIVKHWTSFQASKASARVWNGYRSWKTRCGVL